MKKGKNFIGYLKMFAWNVLIRMKYPGTQKIFLQNSTGKQLYFNFTVLINLLFLRVFATKPFMINSKDFSPQKRKRLYWTNLSIKYEKKPVSLQECLEVGRTTTYNTINTITSKSASLKQGKKIF